jgi:hypothetical protein
MTPLLQEPQAHVHFAMFEWGELEFHAASLEPHTLRDIPDVLNLLDEVGDNFPAIVGLLRGETEKL